MKLGTVSVSSGMWYICLVAMLGIASTSHAAGPEGGASADEVAKQLANPNNDLAKLTFKNRYTWYEGDLPGANSQDNYTLLFQPIFPFSLGHTESGAKEVLFVRPAIPLVVDQPVFNGVTRSFDDVTALGDIGFDLAYGQTRKDGFLWAAGMVGTLPTASDSQAAGGQWRLGPEMLIGNIGKDHVLALFPSHQWDVDGWKEGSFSQTQIQPIAQFVREGGWTFGTKGIFVYDWKADQWTAPLNVNIAKTVIIDKTPWQFEIEVNYYFEKPDAFGPDWMISLNITPVVHNFIEDLFKK